MHNYLFELMHLKKLKNVEIFFGQNLNGPFMNLYWVQPFGRLIYLIQWAVTTNSPQTEENCTLY